MRIALLLAAAVLAPMQTPETKTYADPQLGLSFTYPGTWALQTPPPQKGKKGKPKADEQTAVFKLPIAGSSEQAELTVVRAGFSGSPDTWQQVQLDANKNLKREVTRQWQQEILNVPMLLTRINYSDGGVSKTTLTGLLYSATPLKLLFRLTGPSGDFDKVQYEFTTAMESLRTTSGKLPTEQEAGKPVEPAKPAPDPRELKHPLIDPTAVVVKHKPLIKAPELVNFSVGAKKVALRYPKSWTVSDVKGATLTLHNPRLSGAIQLSGFSTTDAVSPQNALIDAAAHSLAGFDTAEREDQPAKANLAGTPVAVVWRYGKAGKTELGTVDFVITSGDYYVVGSYKSKPGTSFGGERKAIKELVSSVSVELVP